jgi:hypothetical protein
MEGGTPESRTWRNSRAIEYRGSPARARLSATFASAQSPICQAQKANKVAGAATYP